MRRKYTAQEENDIMMTKERMGILEDSVHGMKHSIQLFLQDEY